MEPWLRGEPDGGLAIERDRDVIADVVQIEGIQVPAIFDVVDDEDSSTTRSCPLNGIRGHVPGCGVAAGVIDGECPKASRPPQGPGRVRSRGTRKTRSASPSARTAGAATL